MMTRFFVRVDRGGHRTRPVYTLHTQRPEDCASLCGLAIRGRHSILESQSVALQGTKRTCGHCVKKELTLYPEK